MPVSNNTTQRRAGDAEKRRDSFFISDRTEKAAKIKGIRTGRGRGRGRRGKKAREGLFSVRTQLPGRAVYYLMQEHTAQRKSGSRGRFGEHQR